MKRYIDANKLLNYCRKDIELCGEPTCDIYEWVSRIVEECPAAKNVIALPLHVGKDVWTADGVHGTVEYIYVGKNGVQRYFILLDNGEHMNCKPKGVGKDIFTKNPAQAEISPSAPL